MLVTVLPVLVVGTMGPVERSVSAPLLVDEDELEVLLDDVDPALAGGRTAVEMLDAELDDEDVVTGVPPLVVVTVVTTVYVVETGT